MSTIDIDKTFQIISDIHIEYKSDIPPDPLDIITPSAPILIMAGDIGSFYKINQLETFLTNLCPYYKKVIYVPGNHEYYTFKEYNFLTMYYLNLRIYNIAKKIDNLIILNKSYLIIDDICIAGCTLWSKLDCMLPKYIVRIHRMNEYLYNKKHEEDLDFIKNMINFSKKRNLKLLVVTHHCPTYQINTYNKKKFKKFKSLYHTDLDYLLHKSNVHTWICGHIHSNFDFFTKNGTRIVGNQKGKPRDNIKDYKKDFVIKIN